MINQYFDDSSSPIFENYDLDNENYGIQNLFRNPVNPVNFNFGDNNDYTINNSPQNLNTENEISLNVVNNGATTNRTTNYETINKIKSIKKKKFFGIKYYLKKPLGRKRKNQINNYTNKTHTNSKKDNIIIKIKRRVYKHILNFINLLLEKSKNGKLKKIKLRKNDTSIIASYNIKINKILLKTSVKDILSFKVNLKYKTVYKDYNKEIIKFIIHQNDKDINEALNATFFEMIKIYRTHNDNNNIYKDFKRLDDDITTFNDLSYRNLYRKIAINFEKELQTIKHRNKKRKI